VTGDSYFRPGSGKTSQADVPYLLRTIRKLEDEKLLLQSEEQLHQMVIENASEHFSTITIFFFQTLCEIDQLGYNVNSLSTVRSVLSDSHMQSLMRHIKEMKTLEDTIERKMPSVRVLQDFKELIDFLRGLATENKIDLLKTQKQATNNNTTSK